MLRAKLGKIRESYKKDSFTLILSKVLAMKYANIFTLAFQKFNLLLPLNNTVVVAQSVRAVDCGSTGRGFETHHPPQ